MPLRIYLGTLPFLVDRDPTDDSAGVDRRRRCVSREVIVVVKTNIGLRHLLQSSCTSPPPRVLTPDLTSAKRAGHQNGSMGKDLRIPPPTLFSMSTGLAQTNRARTTQTAHPPPKFVCRVDRPPPSTWNFAAQSPSYRRRHHYSRC
jgi:hypothetical protein